MNDIQDTKDKIAFYRTALGLIVGFLIMFLVAGGMMVVRWYRQVRSLITEEDIGSGLLQTDFGQLEQTLQQRSVPVESKMEIMYGKDIGKLEPFQGIIQQ